VVENKKENYELVLYRLDQIDRKLDAMTRNYVTKDEFEAKISDLEDKLKIFQKRGAIDKVMVGTASTIIASLIWYIVYKAIN
jgi:predicted transcriptional regulator YheO